MAKSKLQIIKEILEKYPPVNSKTPGIILPNETRARNKAMKKAGIFEYIDENGHRVRLDQSGAQKGKWRNTEARNATRRLENPYTGERGVRRDSTLRYTNKRQRGLKASTPELQKEVDAIFAEKDRLNIGKSLDDPTRYTVEHRIQQQAWKDYGLPGNPHDPHNLWLTTKAEAIKKSQIEQNLRAKKYKGKYVVDFNPETRSFHIIPRSEFTIGREAIGGFEIPHAQWSSPGYNSKEVLNKLDNSYAFAHKEAKGFVELMDTVNLEQSMRGKVPLSILNETVDEAKWIKSQLDSSTMRHLGLERPFWSDIEDTLSKPFTLDPESEFAKLGIWHDGPTLDDSWVKISRELNLESGKFDDATGVFHYSKDPTARTSIDILSDIGQGEGEFGDIVNLKNKFHGLKRALPPGEYYLHADDPTKAKYYQRVFANDPWIGPSGEQGGGRLKSGEYVKYDTLKLTVPEAPDQFTQALDGPYPRWQDQGVPRTQLSSEASDVARRTGALNVASDVGTLGRRVGAVLPFVGAGFDAWDVQARYHEMINNPNEGFADWLDKAQFGIASATLGTSFWAEPANAVLGLANLGIDAIRTVVEEDKRREFGQMMRGIGQFATKLF